MPAPRPPTPSKSGTKVAKPKAKRAGTKRQPAAVEIALRAERERVASALHNTICQELTGFYLLACGLTLKYKHLSLEMTEKLLELAEKIQLAGVNLGQLVNALHAGKEGPGDCSPSGDSVLR